MGSSKAPNGWTQGARRGSAAVEFVLVLPVLVGLSAFVVETGRLLADYHTVSKSVRGAARYLARLDGGPAGLGIDCESGTLDAAALGIAESRRLAMTGRIDGDPATDPLVPSWRATDLSEAATGIRISVDCVDNASGALGGTYAGAARIPSIVVSARVPFRFGPGRVLGLDPALEFTVVHKTVFTGPGGGMR
jgi:TadE-like protein